MSTGAATLVVAPAFRIAVPTLGTALAGLLTFVGAMVFWRYLTEIRQGREREIRVDETHLQWLERDRLTERIEGKVAIREIRRLVMEPNAGEPPSLVIELKNGTRLQIPACYLDTSKKTAAFADHWRKAHADTPCLDREAG